MHRYNGWFLKGCQCSHLILLTVIDRNVRYTQSVLKMVQSLEDHAVLKVIC